MEQTNRSLSLFTLQLLNHSSYMTLYASDSMSPSKFYKDEIIQSCQETRAGDLKIIVWISLYLVLHAHVYMYSERIDYST